MGATEWGVEWIAGPVPCWSGRPGWVFLPRGEDLVTVQREERGRLGVAGRITDVIAAHLSAPVALVAAAQHRWVNRE